MKQFEFDYILSDRLYSIKGMTLIGYGARYYRNKNHSNND